MEACYRLFLVPVDAGGTIPASFPAAAKPVLGVELSVRFRVLPAAAKPVPAAASADVHRRVLERRIAASGRTRAEVCGELGWEAPRLLRLLDYPEYEDLFTVLETLGVKREEYFEEVCRELAELAGG